MKDKKLIHGVAFNDADYKVSKYSVVDGKSVRVWICPIYLTWKNMIDRCYSSYKGKPESKYFDCRVESEWLVFSNFKSWMVIQDWAGKELDKDILFPGNKIYSNENCVFVSSRLNTFLVDNLSRRGEFPIGVSWSSKEKTFKSACRNPFTGKTDFLGSFGCPKLAHHAWRVAKHGHALRYADMQTDPRVAQALRTRYLADKEFN